jgi:hypothetical protein
MGANLILPCSLKHISLFIGTWKIFVRTWAIFILIFLSSFLSFLSFLFLFLSFSFFYDSLMPLFATKLFERNINKDLEHLF